MENEPITTDTMETKEAVDAPKKTTNQVPDNLPIRPEDKIPVAPIIVEKVEKPEQIIKPISTNIIPATPADPPDSDDSEPKNNKQKIREAKKIIKPLRTFEDDVANFVKKGKVSTATIVMAEQKRREETAAIKKDKVATKNLFAGVKVSMVLIVFGIIAVVGALIFVNPIERISNFISGPSAVDDTLFDKKSETVIKLNNKINTEVKAEVINTIKRTEQLNPGEISEIKIVKNVSISLDNGRSQLGTEKVSTEDFLYILELNAPEKMTRSLNKDYLFGVIGTEKGNTPFILLGIDDFDRVFSGMFEWEKTMYRQVNDYFSEKLTTNDFETGPDAAYLNNLRDIIIFNRDARAIISPNNSVEFFYTLVNDDYLLMAEDTSIVENIANKLNLQSLVR